MVRFKIFCCVISKKIIIIIYSTSSKQLEIRETNDIKAQNTQQND